jgi:acetyl esterase/lipase
LSNLQAREASPSEAMPAPAISGFAAEIVHPLAPEDRKVMDATRVAMAPGKGHLERRAFDEVMEQTPDALGVTYETAVVGGVAGVWCRPGVALPDAVILYFHGGAYIVGTAHAYRHLAGQIAARSGVAAFVPDYRLAPECRFPAAASDAHAVYRGLLEQGARSIGIVGDSAGGGLALSLLALAQSEALAGAGVAPRAAALMSPWTDLALTAPSLKDRAVADPLLTPDALVAAAEQYLNGHDAHDPLASPLFGDLAGLPPLHIHVGLDEILLDDSRCYFERARGAHVDATLHVWNGMPHVFASNLGKLAAAKQAIDLLALFLREQLGPRMNFAALSSA